MTNHLIPPTCPQSCRKIAETSNICDICDKYWKYRAKLSEINRKIHEKEENGKEKDHIKDESQEDS
jgi:hypothetical protein